MKNELNIYRTFQNIFDNSKVIKGNFSIATAYGNSLDDEKVGEYITNELKPKAYPLVALFPPIDLPGDKFTTQKFKLIFVVKQKEGSIGIKDSLENNTSGHPIIFDWKDMSECAYNFMAIMTKLSKSVLPKPFNFKTEMLERFSSQGIHQLSGVALSFSMEIPNGICENSEYEIEDLGALLSTNDIHPQHQH